jgi:hypothetical protein
MEGTEKNRGVNYRTLQELFKIAEERKETATYNLSVSVLEVYNEQIRDLLSTSPSSKKYGNSFTVLFLFTTASVYDNSYIYLVHLGWRSNMTLKDPIMCLAQWRPKLRT